MQKLIALVLALVCVLVLVGCSKNFEDKPTVIGSIKEIYDDHILIATSTTEGYPYGASVDISISTKDCNEIYNPLTVGDEIIVYYDGNIAESEPAQINTVYAIKLKVKANDKSNYGELQESSDAIVDTSDSYTYEELSEMPANELLDLFIQNGLVINDDLKSSFTEEELQTLFKKTSIYGIQEYLHIVTQCIVI